jgi:hypothetical protein
MTTPGLNAPYGYIAPGIPAISIEDCREHMLNLFIGRHTALRRNTEYYHAKFRPETIGVSVPPEMHKLNAHVGYPRLYVDSITERLSLEGFRLGNADSADDELWEWWQANNLDVEAPLGFCESLVHGTSYITIAAPDPDSYDFLDAQTPCIHVESPGAVFAEIDPRTRQVTQAIRGIYGTAYEYTPQQHRTTITAATLYLPNRTVAWVKEQGQWVIISDVEHNLGIVPVVPVPARTLLSDLHGTSAITPELRSITDAAARILMDMQAAAELMAIPQRLLFGVKPQDMGIDPATGLGGYDAYMARILAFADPEGKAVQFNAAELRNFVEALDQLDKKAAAYTGLPPQYLSYSSQNPASAEAIKASEMRLVKTCERYAIIFGGAWEQAMRIAYLVMNSKAALTPDYYRMESVWSDPSTPTYAAKADAASKLYANGAGVIPKERARIDMGYTIAEREEMKTWDEEEAQGLLGAYTAGPLGAVVDAPVATPPTPVGAAPAAPAKPAAAK